MRITVVQIILTPAQFLSASCFYSRSMLAVFNAVVLLVSEKSTACV